MTLLEQWFKLLMMEETSQKRKLTINKTYRKNTDQSKEKTL